MFNRETFGRHFVAPDPDAEPFGGLVSCTRILLDMAQYEDERLVEAALRLLFRHLNQRTHFVQIAMCTQLLVRPTTARIYYKMRCELTELRAWTPYLDEEGNTRRRKEALIQCSKLMQRWIGVLTPRLGSSNERVDDEVKEAQAMASNLDMHTAVMCILLLPLKRQVTRRAGDLDMALDSERRELFGVCHELVQKLCTANRDMQQYFFEHRGALINQMGLLGLDMETSLSAIVQGNR
jgi:hypothetical protein